MLILGSNLMGCPVMSLHVGDEIGRVVQLIVNPNDLKIIAFRIIGSLDRDEAGDILLAEDIREFSQIGMIVDSSDTLVREGEVMKLDDILALRFEPVGLTVVTKKGTRLGKVSDYMVNPDSFTIQQIVVHRPFLKALNDPELWIGRSEILEIDDEKIVVKDEEAKIKQEVVKDFTPDFVNPFRKQPALQAQTKNLDEQDKQ